MKIISVVMWLDLLVSGPAEAAQEEQLPLVSAHTDILKSAVDHLCFACTNTKIRMDGKQGLLLRTGTRKRGRLFGRQVER